MLVIENLQSSKPKDTDQSHLLSTTHLQFSDEQRGKAQDTHVQYDIRRRQRDIHGSEICRMMEAQFPIASDWPNLEESGEEERSEPGGCDCYESHEDIPHRPDGENAVVEK